MDDLLKYWPVVVVLFNAALFVAVFALTKTFAKKDDVSVLANRILVAEQRLANLPDHDDLADIREALGQVERVAERMSAEISGVKDALKNLTNQLTMLVKHHLDDK